MLFLVMSLTFSFGVTLATADEGTGEGDNTLTVEAVGWSGDVNGAKTNGVANINEADRVEFQIWFSEAIDSGNPTNMLERPEGLSIEAAASALRYIEVNGKTLQMIFDEITAVSKSNVIQDGLLGLHVQGSSHNLQFNFKKNITSAANGKYASLGTDCYFITEEASPYKITKDNVITVKAGFTAMGKTVKEDISFVFNPAGDNNGTWIKDTAEEVNVTSVTSEDKADEVAITVAFDKPINKETVNHMARDNEGTVAAVNGQEKLDHIKANGLRDSVLNKLVVGGKTIKERIDLNKNTPNVEDYDGKLDVHVKGGTDGNKMEIHIKKGVDGSITLEDGMTVTFLGGFRSDLGKFSKDMTIVYNPPVLAGQGGTWVKDTDTELSIKSITSEDKTNAAENEIAITVEFNGPINKETVNHMARENEGTVVAVNGQEKLDNIKANGLRNSVLNKLAVGGSTIYQLMQQNKVDPPEGGDVAGSVDVHVKGGADGNKLEIHIKVGYSGSVALEDGLTVAFLKGFRSDLAKVSEDVVWTYSDGLWAQEGAIIVREELNVTGVTSEEKTNENSYAISLHFGQAINSQPVNGIARENEGSVNILNGGDASKLAQIKANGLRESVWNYVEVNGKTIKEMIEQNKTGNPSGDWDGQLDVHLRETNLLSIEVKLDAPAAIDQSKMTVKVKAGFHTDLVTVSEDISYSFIKGAWYKAGEEPPEQKEVGIVGISHKVGDNDIEITVEFTGAINKERAIHMARENEGTVAAVNSQAVLDHLKATGLRDSVRDLVAVNGKTIKEIIAANQANAEEGADWDGRLDVHIEMKDEVAKIMRIVLKKADGWADFNNDVTVTVKGGFHSDMAIVSEDLTYTYNAANKVWLAPGEKVPAFEAVKLVGVDAPDMKDSAANFNVEFVLRFDEDIDNRQHTYISMEPGFVSSFVGSKNDYSESEIVSFTKFGIFESMAKNILLNGKSVQDMMEQSGWEFPQWPNVAVVHVAQGGTGNNTLRLVIGGQYVNGDKTTHNPFQITDLNQNFVITVKAGLRTPLGQEVKEDISFIYDPNTKQWYAGDSVEDIPVNVTVTFKDGDTVLDTKSCLKGQTITAGIQRKEGYTFDGWYTDAALTQEWDSSKAIEADMTVYAKFTKNDAPVVTPPEKDTGCCSAVTGTVAVIACLALGGLVAVFATKKRRDEE